MRKSFMLFVVAGLMACGTLANAQLTNPNLDNLDPPGTQQLGPTPSDWVVAASRGGVPGFTDGASSEPWANHNPSGTSGLFFKAFLGNPPWDPTAGAVDVDLYQDNPGTPGQNYKLVGWAGAEPNYSGLHTPGANSIFALDFYNGATLLSSAPLDLEAAGLGTSGNTGLNWQRFSISAVAPAGTNIVRARASMLGGVFFQDPGQAFVVDQFSLVPEPTSLMLGFIGVLGLVGLVRRR